mmetsp:Transcript_7401/g.16250  ORF Transcript_7401/g.16250 Transcript_7401/m.16250 type:complete len:220 (-) Transcript_7401:469-1128(-)
MLSQKEGAVDAHHDHKHLHLKASGLSKPEECQQSERQTQQWASKRELQQLLDAVAPLELALSSCHLQADLKERHCCAIIEERLPRYERRQLQRRSERLQGTNNCDWICGGQHAAQEHRWLPLKTTHTIPYKGPGHDGVQDDTRPCQEQCAWQHPFDHVPMRSSCILIQQGWQKDPKDDMRVDRCEGLDRLAILCVSGVMSKPSCSHAEQEQDHRVRQHG